MDSLSDRTRLALQCLPRDKVGRQPSLNSLEDEHGLSRGTLHRIITGERASVRTGTLDRVARALNVDPGWLATGIGTGPTPSAHVSTQASEESGEQLVGDVQLRSDHARSAAVMWARELGLSDEAIAIVLGQPVQPYSAEEWLAAIRLTAAQIRIRRLRHG